MNTRPDSDTLPATSAEPETSAISAVPSPEDEFANETLGERQAEACSLEEGCNSCQ